MNTHLNKFSMMAISLFGFLNCIGCSPKSPKVSTTTCEVRQHPERYDGKLVSIAARIEGDWERMTIISPSCPELGIAVEYSDVATKNGGAEELNAAMHEKLFGSSVRSVSATLSGTFVAAKSPGDAATILVDRVEELQAK